MNAGMERKPREARADIYLRNATVTNSFRESLIDACRREGVTPHEFLIVAAAEKLKASGRQFSGVFRANDLSTLNGGMGI